MTTAQVSARYPRLPALRPDEFGQIKVTAGKDVGESAFEGVNSIHLNFVDGRLIEFVVLYEGAPWESMDQFLVRFTQSLKLPGGWSGEGQYGNRKLVCEGFDIDAGASSYSVNWLTPFVRIREPGAEEVVAQRAAEKRERQRRAFKP